MDTGLNDYAVGKKKQIGIDAVIRKKPKYNCSEEFNRKMMK
jgi:hypothetical protein